MIEYTRERQSIAKQNSDMIITKIINGLEKLNFDFEMK